MSTQMKLPPFDQATALLAKDEDYYCGRITPAYANMVGPFGGVIAAAMLNGVLSHAARQGEPVAMTVNFAAPLADAPFELQVRPVRTNRTNRTNQHWQLELQQGELVAATASVVLAIRQSSWAATELSFPAAPAASELEAWAPPVAPPWVKCYQFRFVNGVLTLSGQPAADSESLFWVCDEPQRPLDFLSLMALSDVFFPRIFVRQQQMCPAGTVSMTTHFHADAAALAASGSRPILARARGQCFSQNYFNQQAELWRDDGILLASSSQMVYFKA